MRHFSNVVLHQKALYITVHSDGMVSGPINCYAVYNGRSILMAVCDALEVSYADAEAYIISGYDDSTKGLSPGERHVLEELIAFNALVEDDQNTDRFLVLVPNGAVTSTELDSFEDEKFIRKSAFLYTNLNTGKSVVWAHSMEV
jgi:hypothetical protein